MLLGLVTCREAARPGVIVLHDGQAEHDARDAAPEVARQACANVGNDDNTILIT